MCWGLYGHGAYRSPYMNLQMKVLTEGRRPEVIATYLTVRLLAFSPKSSNECKGSEGKCSLKLLVLGVHSQPFA
jgi:hypothetical protein